MSNKPFVRVSNSYRKRFWSLSQTAFAPSVPWLIALREACSTPWSGLGSGAANTLAKNVCSPLPFTTCRLQVSYHYS